MSPRSSWALRRTAALVAGVAALPAVGCDAPDERTPGTYAPRVPVVSCLRDAGVQARRVEPIAIVADGVRIDFLATPGAAEARQIAGAAQGAEQIGRALVPFTARPPARASRPTCSRRCRSQIRPSIEAGLMDPERLVYALHPGRARSELRVPGPTRRSTPGERYLAVLRSHPDYAAAETVRAGLHRQLAALE